MNFPVRSRLATVASVGVLTLGALTISACGSDASEESPATTECVPTDTSVPGERGSSNTTVVGDTPNVAGGEGGSAGATEGDQREGSNSAAGDAPDRATPNQNDNTTGNADTGSGGSSRTC